MTIFQFLLLIACFTIGSYNRLQAESMFSVLNAEGQHLLMGPIVQVSAEDNGDTGASKERFESLNQQQGVTPKRAFLSSILLPGLGQILVGEMLRGTVFASLEVAALGMFMNWKGKGLDAEDKFRRDANEQWDPLSYKAWRGSTISRNSSITHALPCSSYVYESLESGGEINFGSCASSDIQQYYELIGKYDQYVAGWVDLVRLPEGNRATYTEVDSVENFRSQMRLDYEVHRDESNRYLKRASWMTGLILVNHVIASIDAARVARNKAAGMSENAIHRRTRFAVVMRNNRRDLRPMLMAYKPIN